MTMTRGAAGYARGAGAYARVGVESGVMSASPHQLISMLFDGAGTAIRAAALHMREGQVAEKGKAISKALDIVNNGLLAALDREKGGELADRNVVALAAAVQSNEVLTSLDLSRTGITDEAASALHEIFAEPPPPPEVEEGAAEDAALKEAIRTHGTT